MTDKTESNTTKFTLHLSRRGAESVRKPLNAVLISITDPNTKSPRIHAPAWLEVLRLCFHDVSSTDPAWVSNGYIPPDETDAKEIAAFIAKHRNKSIVAHCEVGISRSAAVSAVLTDLGWDYIESQRCGLQYANPLLKQLLLHEITSPVYFQEMDVAIT
jgi:predicted protein tyrosine phosphatase